ncbi:FliI/YscN family ATPase [Sandarakinorhabdus sp.]|uniref:FliI/YscN family ATPase n=1 Tax=Sandarakinorhabdus sp. TaxID=1916663 RepID=UPI00286D8E5B|nr:FliI/YscN family ATPase [Sandarakinorhabdus sp.]
MTVTGAIAALASAAEVPGLPLRRGGRVMAFDGSTIEALGIDAAIGSRGLIGPQRQAAELIGFRDGRALFMGLSPLAGVVPGALVLPDDDAGTIACGNGVLGRVIDAMGRPLDGRGPIVAATMRPASPAMLGPADRLRVTRPLATGVRAIDGLLSFGIGQRIGIMAGTGVGKSVLLGQITRWASADIVIMALIGERGREITDFIETELVGPARARTIVVAVPASDAPLLRVRGAMRAFAMAEHFRDGGSQVLLILDSLSRVVHGAREVALARGENAGGRGYPPSSLALIAGLAERAGGDRRSGGAITLVATVLAESDDRADPVVDAARGVMDGHVLLSRKLAGRGQYPAIDLAASASRVMADVVSTEHLVAAARFRRLSSLIDDNRDLVLMGAYAPGSDAELDTALALAPRLEAWRSQPRHSAAAWDDSAASLVALVAP